jgi:hypothetical protein
MLDHKKLEASGGKISYHPSEPFLLSARASLSKKISFGTITCSFSSCPSTSSLALPLRLVQGKIQNF